MISPNKQNSTSGSASGVLFVIGGSNEQLQNNVLLFRFVDFQMCFDFLLLSQQFGRKFLNLYLIIVG
ncbi:MAG TPA: hypothetical protein DCP68_03905 [Ruminococcus sp.]|nr:hypothetical protein [Ruminococcus sp.]